MEIARITVRQNTMQITQHCNVTRGMVGGTVIFEGFGPEWDGLSKTAVFRNRMESRDVVNIQAGEPVAIPWELLETALDDLMVGVCGTNAEGNLVIPTAWGELGRIAPGATPMGRPAEQPAPDWTQQIEGQVNKAIEEATAVRPLAEQVTRDAAAADRSARAAEDSRGAAHLYVETAKNIMNDVARDSQHAGKMANEASEAANRAGESAKTASSQGNRAVNAANRADSAAKTAQDIAQKLLLHPSGGKWELIEQGKLGKTEVFRRTAEPDGTPYKFRELSIYFHIPAGKYENIGKFIIGVANQGEVHTAWLPGGTKDLFCTIEVYRSHGFYKLEQQTSENKYLYGKLYGMEINDYLKFSGDIIYFKSEAPFPAGTEFTVRAVRA